MRNLLSEILVDWEPIMRTAWTSARQPEPLWLTVDPNGPGIEALGNAAALASDELENDGVEDGEVPELEFESDSMIGPVIGVGVGEHDARTRVWLTAFARNLESAGYAGTIRTVRDADSPRWEETLPNPLRCFAAYTCDPDRMRNDPYRHKHWLASPAATREITTTAVYWASTPGATTLFNQSGFGINLDGSSDQEVATALASALKVYCRPSVGRYDESIHLKRMVEMGPAAEPSTCTAPTPWAGPTRWSHSGESLLRSRT